MSESSGANKSRSGMSESQEDSGERVGKMNKGHKKKDEESSWVSKLALTLGEWRNSSKNKRGKWQANG